MITHRQFRPVFPALRSARYNVAAWRHARSGHLMLIGRDVKERGKPGEPDVGTLVLAEFDHAGTLLEERIVWKPHDGTFSLEDPRALVEDNGSISIGLTAVVRTPQSVEPYPALTRISHDWVGELPPVHVIQEFGMGKNMTPLGNRDFLFRPEGQEYFHKLLLFHMDGEVPKKIQDLPFPQTLPWAQWRIGTTMPPLWLPDMTGLFIIHGITMHEGKYIYSIGLAQLIPQEVGFKLKVDPEPLLTPDTFEDEAGKPLVEELRPEERRVVYACGGVIDHADPDELKLYVNVGDRTTFEVDFVVSELKRRLDACECV